MLNLHGVMFCTGIDHDDTMQIDCLAYKYFVFYRFSLVGYNIWYCVVCDDMVAPPPPKKKKKTHTKNRPINIYQKSEFLKLIIVRIICEF